MIKFLTILPFFICSVAFSQSNKQAVGKKYIFKIISSQAQINQKNADREITILDSRLKMLNYEGVFSFDSIKNEITLATSKTISRKILEKSLTTNNDAGFAEVYDLFDFATFLNRKKSNQNTGKDLIKLLNIPKVVSNTGNNLFPYIGNIHLKDTPAVNRILRGLKDQFPEDLHCTYSTSSDEGTIKLYALRSIKMYLADKSIMDTVYAGKDERGYPELHINFSKKGAQAFGDLTEKNINKFISIVINGAVYSAPLVHDRIEGGKLVISGNFTLEELKVFTQTLMDGTLPFQLRLMN